MKILKNYVDTMFIDFPKTKANEELKENILESMTNSLSDLMSDGMSEQEAIGKVISRFGDIDELKLEYGVLAEVEEDEREYLSTETLHEYLNFCKKYALAIALSVCSIIIGVTLPIYFSGASDIVDNMSLEQLMEFGESYYILQDVTISTAGSAIGGILFLSVIAVAVGIIVFFSIKGEEYNDIDNGIYYLKGDDKAMVQDIYNGFRGKMTFGITAGVVLCIVAVISFTILSSFIVFFSLIALGVFQFIYFGIMGDVYDKLLESEKVKKEHKKEASYEWIYGICMPLAAMVFLTIGFVWNVWHPTWIIFPVTAIVVSGIVEVLKRK